MSFSWMASGGEEKDRVINLWFGGRRDWWGIAAVQGHIQVGDVVDQFAADHTSLL